MKELHRPIQIGPLELRNRVVMPPIATYRSTEDGKVTDDLLSYYGARASNERIGLIITEHSYIVLQGKAKARQLSIVHITGSEHRLHGVLAPLSRRNNTTLTA